MIVTALIVTSLIFTFKTNVTLTFRLKTLPIKVEKSVKESGDTARLHKKFEKKLSALVSPVTPLEMYDSMQGTNLITTLFSV